MVDSTATDFCSPPRFRRSSDRCRQKTNLPAEQSLTRQQGLLLQDCIVPIMMEIVRGIGTIHNFPLIVIMLVHTAHVLHP